MAFGQDFIHLAPTHPAQPRRQADAKRCQAPGAAGLDGPRLPSGIAPGLTRQVFERCLYGRKAAAQRSRIDGVVPFRTFCRGGDVLGWPEQRNAGIERHVDDADAGIAPSTCGKAAMIESRVPARVEELKRDAALPPGGRGDAARRSRPARLR